MALLTLARVDSMYIFLVIGGVKVETKASGIMILIYSSVSSCLADPSPSFDSEQFTHWFFPARLKSCIPISQEQAKTMEDGYRVKIHSYDVIILKFDSVEAADIHRPAF